MSIATKIYTSLFGKYVGQDEYGNRYYCLKTDSHKRWVVYPKDIEEPSLVPPEWHGWLHKITDEVPSATRYKRYKWQKKHQPNLTGTKFAYYPPGHILRGGKRRKTTGDYTAWNPNEDDNG